MLTQAALQGQGVLIETPTLIQQHTQINLGILPTQAVHHSQRHASLQHK